MEKTTKKPSGRPVRKSVGARDRLAIINKDPSKVYRLVDTEPGRIQYFLDLGYEIQDVKNHIPNPLRLNVGSSNNNTIPVGGGKEQVLMAIDKELWEEIQDEKARIVDNTEAGLKPQNSDGFYGDIQITRK